MSINMSDSDMSQSGAPGTRPAVTDTAAVTSPAADTAAASKADLFRQFDSLSIAGLHAGGSLKWSEPANHPDAIGMFVAEMDFGLAPAVADVLRTAAASSGVGYPTSALSDTAISSAREWYASVTGTRPRREQLHITPNVLSVMELALRKLLPAGAPVIVPTPAYMPMLTIPPKYGHPVIEVPAIMTMRDGLAHYELDLAAIDRALATAQAQAAPEHADKAPALLALVNPWNPVGRVFSRAELSALDAVLARYPQARVFVDEIHASLVLDGEFTSYASISENSARQAITAFSPTKGWNFPGLRVANALLTRADDAQNLAPELESLSGMTPTIGVRAQIAAYRDAAPWLAAVREYLRENRAYLEQRVAQMPGVSVTHIEGTYIAWLEFSAAAAAKMAHTSSAPAAPAAATPTPATPAPPAAATPAPPAGPAQWLLENAGVVLTDGTTSGARYTRHARMIIATARPILAQALDRIAAALQS